MKKTMISSLNDDRLNNPVQLHSDAMYCSKVDPDLAASWATEEHIWHFIQCKTSGLR